MEAIIYHRDGDAESALLAEYLHGLMIECRLRPIDNGDRAARQEWEDLDGEVTPLLVMDRRQIVRGFDRTRVDQLVGCIGC